MRRRTQLTVTLTRKPTAFPSLAWAALGVLAFSFTFPATTLAERTFAPLLVGAGRSVIAAATAAVCLAALRAPLPGREHWPGLIAAVVRVGDRPGLLFWAASIVGTVTVTSYALSRGGGALHPADLLLLGSVIVAAVGYAEGGRLTRTVPGWQVTAWGLLIALPISVPLTVVALLDSPPTHPTASSIAGLAYVGTISTFIGFFAWYRGLAESQPAPAPPAPADDRLVSPFAWRTPRRDRSLYRAHRWDLCPGYAKGARLGGLRRRFVAAGPGVPCRSQIAEALANAVSSEQTQSHDGERPHGTHQHPVWI